MTTWDELQEANFALAANQCHDSYGDERGNHRCKYQDRIAELEARLSMASAFDLIWQDPFSSVPRMRIERTGYKPDAWAIRVVGACLNRENKFEVEPQPSSRDEEFFARCRWDTAEEAMDFAVDHVAKYGESDKLENDNGQ